MRRFRVLAATAAVAGVLLFALSGCEKGPAEKAGADIDNAVERAGESVEEAGDDIRDAARNGRD